ncbi:hypothetical protein BKA65DRAFT_470970 [Rhexocercosporidium sp. MPI-PUGE-AT-0058]|nr:hypothetical protein BKA65DRAFT_470970 [Rhexocercosporidium sp. MPI-PUGE-AT-0058]
MCRVKKLLSTKCGHISGVMLAFPDEWCQYRQAYPDTPFQDCPNSNKGTDVQIYPDYDWCPGCKDAGMHRTAIETNAQALQAGFQNQGYQPGPVYQADPYQAQGYQANPYQQQQIQYQPEPNFQQGQYQLAPNQQSQYQPDPYQQNPGYHQRDPGSPVAVASPYAPGSPVNQSYHHNPGYQADPNIAAGQQQGYPAAPRSPESVGEIFDSVFTLPANSHIQNYQGGYGR